MKRYVQLAVIMAWGLSAGLLYAQDGDTAEADTTAAAEAVPEETITDIAAPDAEGVFPSIMHKGEIQDFLKFIGVAANKNIVPSPNVRGQISVNLFNVTWKEVLDVVLTTNGFAYEEEGQFIFVYTEKELEEKKAAARKTISKVFALNYIKPGDVVALISPMMSEAGEITTTPEAASGSTDGDAWAGQSMIIVVDYPEYIEEISKAIKDIDQRPPQVLIEATILKVTLDDNLSLGVDFNALGGVDFVSTGTDFIPDDGSGTALKGTATALDLSDGNLKIGVVKGNIGMFVDALESINDTVLIGNPKVLTLNRQEGMVQVGTEEGYITTESTATSTTQTVEFLQTGTILKFTPYIMDDGFIRLKLNPENSDGQVNVQGQFALPFKETSQVTTNVLVKDGRTIVIGGLFQEDTTMGRSQVPVVGNVPILGNLFRHSDDSNVKTETIFLITPRIVRDEVDYAAADDVMEMANTLVIGAREGMLGLARNRIASAHYHLAKEMESNGRLDAALWHAKMTVHVSPIFQDALEYRNELLGQQIYRGRYGDMRNFMQELIEEDQQSGAITPFGN